MNATTVILAILCIVTGAIAWWPEKSVQTSGMDRVGTIIGKEANPDEVAEVTVTTWDDTAKTAKTFQVRRKGQGWIIPSRYDYPADGGSRIGKTAGIMGLTRGRFVTRDPASFDELGVIDPGTTEAGAAKNRGKRVLIKDGAGGTIVDLIIGLPAGDGTSFVREADSNEVFTAKVDADISTRFTDWVEDDLLKIQKDDIRGLMVRDYSIDEQRGTIDMRDEMGFSRSDANDAWESPNAPSGKRAKKAEVDTVVNELTWLRLTGIRPFDPAWLQKRGFFLSDAPALLERKDLLALPVGGGRRMVLLGNEGHTSVTTKDGLTHHCFFGEIALGEDQDTAADASAPAEGEDAAAGHDRYLVVWVTYDPADDELAAAAAATPPPKEGEEPGPKPEDLRKQHQDAAEAANQRFSRFFYVISNSSFEKLRPTAEKLYEDLPAEAKARGTDQPISAWMKANGEKPGVSTTPSGLQYEVVEKGREDGKQPTPANRVKVRYVGTRIDGEQFDAGTTEFAVTGVIKGWTEALQLMREGAVWKLTIPPDLAYGDQGQGEKIGPNEILQFEVELIEVLE